MVLECLTWIPCILDEVISVFLFSSKNGAVRAYLPDDVIINILSRIPADCVLECRRVCKKWRALTLSPYFAELHLKRATTVTTPSLFMQIELHEFVKQGQLNFFIYDNNDDCRRRRKRRIITKVLPTSGKSMYHYKARVLGSCNGLLMFLATDKTHRVFVFNPITRDLVILPVPFEYMTPCGIYFHPLTREYKLLLCVFKEGNNKNHLQTYYTSSLKSKVWEKLNYSSNCKTRTYNPAILLNGSLHWMVNRNEKVKKDSLCTDSILAFDTETEDFRILPHPGDMWCYYYPREHENMYLLLGTRDHLYQCHVTWGEFIDVWVLEDYAGWAWDMKYKVNLDWDVKRFPFRADYFYGDIYHPKNVNVLGIQNGEMVICWEYRGVFSYNLVKNTVNRLSFKLEGCHTPNPYASAYSKSLIRLK